MTNVRRPKVLILDDSDICREMTQIALEERGYEVVALDGPFGFSAALNRERPDLALVDVELPGLDGAALTTIARRHGLHRCPIVLFSDRSEAELIGLARDCGAAGFLRKTADPDTLAAAVERFLGAGC
ncbi:MAG TPA: response regulator [Polyangia bacterium]|jgi:DNA-binding response OmpR family regulator